MLRCSLHLVQMHLSADVKIVHGNVSVCARHSFSCLAFRGGVDEEIGIHFGHLPFPVKCRDITKASPELSVEKRTKCRRRDIRAYFDGGLSYSIQLWLHLVGQWKETPKPARYLDEATGATLISNSARAESLSVAWSGIGLKIVQVEPSW